MNYASNADLKAFKKVIILVVVIVVITVIIIFVKVITNYYFFRIWPNGKVRFTKLFGCKFEY